MGKTYKRLCVGYHRAPRGHKRARIQGARHKAIPPSAWDDLNACDQAYFPFELARRFYDDGMSREEAAKKLKTRFHLKPWELLQVLYQWDADYDRDYPQEAFETLSRQEQIAMRLRYGDDLASWHNDFLTKYRGERNTLLTELTSEDEM